jgi:uncharacterized protein
MVSIFSGLIELQRHDTAVAQLHHRRSHLPEHEALMALAVEVGSLERQTAPTRASRASLQVKMEALESSVHDLDVKIEAVQSMMFSGTVTSPRELQGMEADIVSVKKRRSELEDNELELIDQAEPLDAIITAADTKLVEAANERDRLDRAVLAAQTEIDVVASGHIVQRADLVRTLDAPTVALYEATRSKNRGVGAVLIEHGTCMSCKIKIAAIELDRIRQLPVDTLVRCEECSVILVR